MIKQEDLARAIKKLYGFSTEEFLEFLNECNPKVDKEVKMGIQITHNTSKEGYTAGATKLINSDPEQT